MFQGSYLGSKTGIPSPITGYSTEHYADPDLISLSERRQLEQGEETIFESRSGRLFRGCLADLQIKSPSQGSPSPPPPLSPSTANSPSSDAITKAAVLPSKQKARRKRRKDNRQKDQNRASPLSTPSPPSPKSSSSSSAEDAVKRADEWLTTKSAPVRQSLSTSDREFCPGFDVFLYISLEELIHLLAVT